MCVSAATLAGCQGTPVRPVGQLVLKGKTQSLQVFEPMAAQTMGYAPLTEYEDAYAAMEAQSPAAPPAFSKLAQRFPQDPLVNLHAQRLQSGALGTRIVLQDK